MATTTFVSSIRFAPRWRGARRSDELGRREAWPPDRSGGSRAANRGGDLPDPVRHLRLLLPGRGPERRMPLRPDALDTREGGAVDQRFLRLQHRRHRDPPRPHFFGQGARHVVHGADPVGDFSHCAAAPERGSRIAVLGVCNLPDDGLHDRPADVGVVRRDVSLRAISRRVGGPRRGRRADSRPRDDRVSVRH